MKKPLQIYINEKQREWLEKQAKKDGLALTQVVTTWINEQIKKEG